MEEEPRATPRRVRRLWLWRWRSNPLRRPSDRMEAWFLLTVWVGALLGAVLTGWVTQTATMDSLAASRSAAERVSAVVTQMPLGGTEGKVTVETYSDQAWAQVRWTADDGTAHTGAAWIDAEAAVGTSVTVWTNGADKVIPEPVGGSQAERQAVLLGVLAGLAVAAVGLSGGHLALRRLENRSVAGWETEWALVEPQWRKRMLG
ncbi:hypothetical protein [Streptomyces sp. NPDC057877]|uniref:Rv1733c family protein n=1 Tax=Streptomyces sp. NPDC057877 TaxID=3346269 RepID=UPI00367977E6